jgi:ATP-dependent RNA helicase SUPV3L1/SUV3
VSAEATAAPAAEAPAMIEVWRAGRPSDRPRHQGKPRRSRRPDQAAPGSAAAAPGEAAPGGAAEPRPQRKPRRDRRPEHKDRPHGERPPRRDRERERPAFAKPRPERREKTADPNSPFAKLAALKAQLEADSKERR